MYRHVKIATVSEPQAWAVGLCAKTRTLPAGYAELDLKLGGAISSAVRRAEFSAEAG